MDPPPLLAVALFLSYFRGTAALRAQAAQREVYVEALEERCRAAMAEAAVERQRQDDLRQLIPQLEEQLRVTEVGTVSRL